MYRVGIYIDAPATEFLEWLETWTHRDQAAGSAGGHGRITLGAAQRRTLLSQHLVVEVHGTLESDQTDPEPTPVSVAFRVLPVGLGHSVVVDGITDTQELFTCLVEFAAGVEERWPQAAATAWFGDPPCREIDLCALNIPTTVQTLEKELARFAALFATPEIRSVSYFPATGSTPALLERQSLLRSAHWEFRLSFHTDGPWQGIEHVAVMGEMSRESGTRHLTVTLRCQGPLYKEIGTFVGAFIAQCRSRWNDTQVLRIADRLGAIAIAASPRELPADQLTGQDWTLADRPWEVVADNAWDRRLVELWWHDHPSATIAQRLGVTPKTVLNRLSELRKTYGKNLVPTDSRRRGGRRDKWGYPG